MALGGMSKGVSNMKDFISIVKNISTEEFIKFWGELSIEIYWKQLSCINQDKLNATMKIPLKIYQYGFIQRDVEVSLSAWDIPDMIYTSICESNDYRKGHMTIDMAEKNRRYFSEHCPLCGFFPRPLC